MAQSRQSDIPGSELKLWRADFERVSGIVATLKETAQERRDYSWQKPLLYNDVTLELDKTTEKVETRLRERSSEIEKLKRGNATGSDNFRFDEARFLYDVAVSLALLDGPVFRSSGVGFRSYVEELLGTAKERVLHEITPNENPSLRSFLHSFAAKLVGARNLLVHGVVEGNSTEEILLWRQAKEEEIEYLRKAADEHLQTDDTVTTIMQYAKNAGDSREQLDVLYRELRSIVQNGKAQRELQARLQRQGGQAAT